MACEKQQVLWEPAMDNLPPGWRFVPTEKELIHAYLFPKIAGITLPCHVIKEIAGVFDYDPHLLPLARHVLRDSGSPYFFGFMKSEGNERRLLEVRPTPCGYWKVKRPRLKLINEKETIAFRKTSIFIADDPSDKQKKDWIMHEYELNLASSHFACFNDPLVHKYVICKVFKRGFDPCSRSVGIEKLEEEEEENEY